MLNVDDRLLSELMPEVGIDAVVVLLAICTHMSKKTRTCYPSNDRLKKMTGISRDRIERALRVLKSRNILDTKKIKDDKGKFTKRLITVKTDLVGIFVGQPEKQSPNPYPEIEGMGSNPYTRLEGMEIHGMDIHSMGNGGTNYLSIINDLRSINYLRKKQLNPPIIPQGGCIPCSVSFFDCYQNTAEQQVRELPNDTTTSTESNEHGDNVVQLPIDLANDKNDPASNSVNAPAAATDGTGSTIEQPTGKDAAKGGDIATEAKKQKPEPKAKRNKKDTGLNLDDIEWFQRFPQARELWEKYRDYRCTEHRKKEWYTSPKGEKSGIEKCEDFYRNDVKQFADDLEYLIECEYKNIWWDWGPDLAKKRQARIEGQKTKRSQPTRNPTVTENQQKEHLEEFRESISYRRLTYAVTGVRNWLPKHDHPGCLETNEQLYTRATNKAVFSAQIKKAITEVLCMTVPVDGLTREEISTPRGWKEGGDLVFLIWRFYKAWVKNQTGNGWDDQEEATQLQELLKWSRGDHLEAYYILIACIDSKMYSITDAIAGNIKVHNYADEAVRKLETIGPDKFKQDYLPAPPEHQKRYQDLYSRAKQQQQQQA